MDRRTFIGRLALGALAIPSLAAADAARKVYRIGILGAGLTSDLVGPEPRSPYIKALLRGLRQHGYVYGEQFTTEARGGEGKPERYPILAAELVRLRVDVILAASQALRALKQATATIPIVMAAGSDPVAEGVVQSLGHPGGNFTGLSHDSIEITGKLLELLKDLVPDASPVAVLWDRGASPSWQAAEAGARARGWKLLSLEIRRGGEIEKAFRTATDSRAGALLVLTGDIAWPNRQRIAQLAARSRLPAIYDRRAYVEAGGLMSYSADLIEIWYRAAWFVDKILKGAKPADLPIEQPTKFDLVINLKTAKSLGVVIPQLLRMQAELIE
jgi:putative ABC transport system substrate-binding protein